MGPSKHCAMPIKEDLQAALSGLRPDSNEKANEHLDSLRIGACRITVDCTGHFVAAPSSDSKLGGSKS